MLSKQKKLRSKSNRKSRIKSGFFRASQLEHLEDRRLLTQLTNGSFESGFTDLTVVNGTGTSAGGGQGVTDGTAAAKFNGGNLVGNTSISQSFTTVAGQRYMLEFDYGVFGANRTQQMNAQIVGNYKLGNATVSGTGPAGTNDTTWSRYHFAFVADSASTTLTFTDMTTVAQSNSADGNLDNVSVTPVSTGVVSPGGDGTVGTVNFASGNWALSANGGVATHTNTGFRGVSSRRNDGNINVRAG